MIPNEESPKSKEESPELFDEDKLLMDNNNTDEDVVDGKSTTEAVDEDMVDLTNTNRFAYAQNSLKIKRYKNSVRKESRIRRKVSNVNEVDEKLLKEDRTEQNNNLSK